jgi:hypothetical protein
LAFCCLFDVSGELPNGRNQRLECAQDRAAMRRQYVAFDAIKVILLVERMYSDRVVLCTRCRMVRHRDECWFRVITVVVSQRGRAADGDGRGGVGARDMRRYRSWMCSSVYGSRVRSSASASPTKRTIFLSPSNGHAMSLLGGTVRSFEGAGRETLEDRIWISIRSPCPRRLVPG